MDGTTITSAPARLTDADLITRFRDLGYRGGYVEFQLEMARDELAAALGLIPADIKYAGRRMLLQTRVDSIDRTLRLVAAASTLAGARP